MSEIGLTKDRRITIDLGWLLGAMTDEQKREIADSLACEDSIIEDVAAQLITGWTEAASHGATSYDASAPSTPLSIARRKVALAAGDVAATEIAELVRQLKWQKQLSDHYSDACFSLQRHWPDGYRYSMPSIPAVPLGDPELYVVTKKEAA